MPTPSNRWYHVILSTRSTWLPGDPRGFRNRQHRIHSSGDYKNPPPPHEHVGLLRYNELRSSPPVRIPPASRAAVGTALVRQFTTANHPPLALSVSATHAHVLLQLPAGRDAARRVIGKCKDLSSYEVREELPGAIWARGAQIKPIRDRQHQVNTYRYITARQERDAWIWREPTIPRPPPTNAAT